MERFWFLGVNCLGFWKLIVQFFFVCFELTWVGGEGWGFEGWRAQPRKSRAPKGGGPKGGGPKFRAFFFPVPPQNSFFSSLSGGLLVEFWWCLKRRGPVCTFGLSGCRVKPRHQVHLQVQYLSEVTNWHPGDRRNSQNSKSRIKRVVTGGCRKTRWQIFFTGYRISKKI